MPADLLPRGNVREFESWLIRRVNFAHAHYTRLEAEGAANTSNEWIALGDLTMSVNILAEYTDRDPNEIHKVAGDYREVRRVIFQGRSWKKEIDRHVEQTYKEES